MRRQFQHAVKAGGRPLIKGRVQCQCSDLPDMPFYNFLTIICDIYPT